MFLGNLTGFGSGSPGGPRSYFADCVALGLTTNLRLCLDIGSIDCFDGSSQSVYDLTTENSDFWRGEDDGASSDDPAFSGVAGALSSAEYLSTDGGDHLHKKASMDSWQDEFHKDNASFSMLFWIYCPSNIGSNSVFFHTNNADANGIKIGLSGSDEKLDYEVRKAPSNAFGITTDTSANTSAWNFIGIVIDEGGGGSASFWYLNGAYNQVGTADTWNAAYTSPSSATGDDCDFFENGNAGEACSSGVRLSGCMIWNDIRTKANFDSLWALQRTRFGL